MTIFSWQLRVTLDSIRNSWDVFLIEYMQLLKGWMTDRRYLWPVNIAQLGRQKKLWHSERPLLPSLNERWRETVSLGLLWREIRNTQSALFPLLTDSIAKYQKTFLQRKMIPLVIYHCKLMKDSRIRRPSRLSNINTSILFEIFRTFELSGEVRCLANCQW